MSDLAGNPQNKSPPDRRPGRSSRSSKRGLDIPSLRAGRPTSRVSSEDSDENRLLGSSHHSRRDRDPDAVPIQRPTASAHRKPPKPDAAFRFQPVNNLSSAQKIDHGPRKVGVRPAPLQLTKPTHTSRHERETRSARRQRVKEGVHSQGLTRNVQSEVAPQPSSKPTLFTNRDPKLYIDEYGDVENLTGEFKRKRLRRSDCLSPSAQIATEEATVNPPWMKLFICGEESRQSPFQEEISIRKQKQPPDEHNESEDELQALDVTVQQPSKGYDRSHPPKRSWDEAHSFHGDLFAVTSTVIESYCFEGAQMMAVNWATMKAHLDPPQPSSHAHPQSISLDKITSLITPEDSDGRKIMLKFMKSSVELDDDAILEFDSRQSLDSFTNEVRKKCSLRLKLKSSSWLDSVFERKKHRQLIQKTDVDSRRPDGNAVVSHDSTQNPHKRQKMVHQLEPDENKITYEHQSLSLGRKSGGGVPIPVRKFISTSSLIPQRETRSMAQHREDEPKPRDLSPIVKAPPKWSKSLVFPKTGKKRAEVEAQDLERLRDDEFLNDNLIGLYTRFLEYHFEQKRPDLAKRIYFFNSYFYARLTDKPRGQKEINYDAVAKWTRTVDLFSFDYVIVPINENAHWFMAIICNLRNLFSRPEDDHGVDGVVNSSQQDNDVDESTCDVGEEQSAAAAPSSGNDETSITDLLKNTTIGEDSSNKTPKKLRGKRKQERRLRTYEPDQPMIITFDSLGCPRQPIVRALKDYLVAEAKFKRDEDINKETISGMTAKEIPLQKNFSDCGLYLLAYLERFSQNPDEFVHKLLRREMKLQRDWPQLNSRELRKRFRDFLLALHDEQNDSTRSLDSKDTMSRSLHVLLPPLHPEDEDSQTPVHESEALKDPPSATKAGTAVNKGNDSTEKGHDTLSGSTEKEAPTIPSSLAPREQTGRDDDEPIILLDRDDRNNQVEQK
ncbi:hypothetical protein KEM56_004497 [Ascosphaera pollenicola]|nr:hypothetical protein KEM56_004497 [Ascosphaera pollenicola]